MVDDHKLSLQTPVFDGEQEYLLTLVTLLHNVHSFRSSRYWILFRILRWLWRVEHWLLLSTINASGGSLMLRDTNLQVLLHSHECNWNQHRHIVIQWLSFSHWIWTWTNRCDDFFWELSTVSNWVSYFFIIFFPFSTVVFQDFCYSSNCLPKNLKSKLDCFPCLITGLRLCWVELFVEP